MLPARRMRIVHLLAPAEVGGLERVVDWLATGQMHRAHDVLVALVVTSDHYVSEWVEQLRARGIAVEVLEIGGRSYLQERARVCALIEHFRADVLHTHGFRPDVIDGGVARRVGVACVTTLHGMTGDTLRTRVYEWLQRRMVRRFDAVIAVSRPLGSQLLRAGVPEERLFVVPNAWMDSGAPVGRDAARQHLGIAADEFAIGWVGRLTREKGADVMIDALAALRDVPAAKLTIIGDGRDRGELMARAEQLGVGARVRWAGRVSGAARFYRAFDAWVLSSRTEGTPIVLFEAMHAGTPIVATRVGGVPDVVDDTEALLVTSEQPAELARAIRSIHDDRASAATRAQRARLRLDRDHGSDQWLARYEQIYQAIANPLPVHV